MGQSSGQTRAISTTGLPSFQQPYAEQVLGEGKRLYEENTPTFYPRPTVAPLSETESDANKYLQRTSGDIANMYDPNGNFMNSFNFGLKAADVGNNPYAQAAVNAAIDPVFRRLDQYTLPGARSDAMQVGGYGGSRDQIYRALLTSEAQQNALNASSSLMKDMYQQGLNTQTQTMGMMPQVSAGMLLPGMTLAGVGAQERALNQAQIDEQVARHNFNQSVPYTKLIEYANLVNHPYGGQGTSEVQAVGPTGTAQTVGGVLSGVGLTWDILSRIFGWGR